MLAVTLLPLISSWVAPVPAVWTVGPQVARCRSEAGCVGSSSSSSLGGVRRLMADCSERAPSPAMAIRRGRQQRAPPKPVDNTPINEMIKFEEMRVIVDMGAEADEMLGVLSKADALAKAEELGLDLVLIAAKGEVPLCKIVSFDKYRYAKEKKKKELKRAASTGQELKELKMSYKIGEHDYDVRKKQATRFLKQGNKVRARFARRPARRPRQPSMCAHSRVK